jgi:hypothetical protein
MKFPAVILALPTAASTAELATAAPKMRKYLIP